MNWLVSSVSHLLQEHLKLSIQKSTVGQSRNERGGERERESERQQERARERVSEEGREGQAVGESAGFSLFFTIFEHAPRLEMGSCSDTVCA